MIQILSGTITRKLVYGCRQRVLNGLWQCSSALYCAELLYKTTMVGRLLESYWTQQLPGSFSNEKHVSDNSNQKMMPPLLIIKKTASPCFRQVWIKLTLPSTSWKSYHTLFHTNQMEKSLAGDLITAWYSTTTRSSKKLEMLHNLLSARIFICLITLCSAYFCLDQTSK